MSRLGQAVVAAGVALVLHGSVHAFHDGGVANCNGCHIMHEETVAGGGSLLLGDNASDLCLSCHAEGLGAVLGSDPLIPPAEKGAGNFVFLLEDNLNDAPDGATNPIRGEAAGHSVVVPGRGLLPDSRNAVSPGGTFPSSQLGCTSCHDPHGNASFRMLYGTGTIQGGLATFAFPSIDARGIRLSGVESNGNHTAYRAGVSNWCANCHGNYHETSFAGFEHPGDHNMSGATSPQYNRYDGDDRPTSGTQTTAYLADVPFEDPTAAVNSTQGPQGASRVMCLTCHRAHASSAPSAGRWDFNVALLEDDGAVSQSYAIPNPYNSPAQGTLCTKCHQGGASSARSQDPFKEAFGDPTKGRMRLKRSTGRALR